jgi:hypothetical protein
MCYKPELDDITILSVLHDTLGGNCLLDKLSNSSLPGLMCIFNNNDQEVMLSSARTDEAAQAVR